MAADWSELQKDILVGVLKRLPVVSHRLRFRSVCTSWQWVELDSQQFSPEPLQVPGLMVSTALISESRMFYSLSEKKIYSTLSLPVPHSLRCMGVTSPTGWQLTVDKQTYETALFNPFSQTKISLPPTYKLKDPRKPHQDVPLSYYPMLCGGAASSGDPDKMREAIVMVIIQNLNKLAFARPGDEYWTLIVKKVGTQTWQKTEKSMSCIVFFKEHFYAMENHGRVLYRCDDIGAGTDHDPKLVAVASFPHQYGSKLNFTPTVGFYYLVESLGDLFLVEKLWRSTDAAAEKRRKFFEESLVKRNPNCLFAFESLSEEGEDAESRGDWKVVEDHDHQVPGQKGDASSNGDAYPGYGALYFDAFKVDMEARRLVKVKRLGDRAFVVGWNSAFSVSATDIHGYKPNCIYFQDDYDEDQHGGGTGRAHDTGVFCLEDGSIESIYPQPSQSHTCIVPVPLWLTLIPS